MLNECGQHNDQHVQLICYNTHTHIYTRKKTDNYFPFPIGSCVNVGNSTEIMSINKQHEQQPSNRHGHMIQYWLDKLPSFNHSINRHCWPHNIDNTLVNQWKIVALAPAQLASLRCFFNIYPNALKSSQHLQGWKGEKINNNNQNLCVVCVDCNLLFQPQSQLVKKLDANDRMVVYG